MDSGPKFLIKRCAKLQMDKFNIQNKQTLTQTKMDKILTWQIFSFPS